MCLGGGLLACSPRSCTMTVKASLVTMNDCPVMRRSKTGCTGCITEMVTTGQGEKMGESEEEPFSPLSSRSGYTSKMVCNIGPEIFCSIKQCCARVLCKLLPVSAQTGLWLEFRSYYYKLPSFTSFQFPSHAAESSARAVFAAFNQPRHINYKFLQRFKHLGLIYVPITDDY